MAEDKILLKYERLWQRRPHSIYMHLCGIKTLNEDWQTILPQLFAIGVKYDVISAALFARNIMEDNAWYKELVLQTVQDNMSQLQRNAEDLKSYLAEVGVLWKALILSWDENNFKQIHELLCKLYNDYVGDKAVLTAGTIKNRDFRIADEILKCPVEGADVNSIDDVYPIQDVYIRNVYILRQLVEKDNLAEIEVYHKNLIFLDRMDEFTKSLLNAYIEDLLLDKNYKALACFLQKTANVDYEAVYGQTKDAFWNRMIGTQSERLADCYLRISGKEDADYLDKWIAKVYELVQNPTSLSWCAWAYYWFYLGDLLDEKELAEEAFQEIARRMKPENEFPFAESMTFNRITGAVTYLFSEVWERGWNPFFLLDLWEENNLYSYNRRQIYRKSPIGFQNSEKIHNWEAHLEAFWAYECSEEERIRLYMNSPIRCVIDFRTAMIEFAKRVGEDRFKSLFQGYLLEGYLRNIDSLNAAGHLRFEISDHFCSQYRWKTRGIKDKKFYSGLLFNDETWYRKNEFLAKRMKLDVPCSFRLCGCYMTGYHDAVLYVDDISTHYLAEIDEMQEIQRNEMQEALEWMRQIREQKSNIPVHKKSFQNLTFPHRVNMTQKFAEAIFDTVFALRENPTDAFRFLGMIHIGRLDKISAYQYILSRENLFSFKVNGGLGSVWKRMNDLCKDRHFTAQQKVNIYMNTYLRCFCGFAGLWTKLQLQEGDMINLAARNSEYDKFLFLVDFMGNENGNAVFLLNESIKMKIGEKGEDYHWCLKGAELSKEQIGKSFRVSVRDIDTEEKIIWIGQLYEKNIKDRWALTVRRINDLKDNPSLTHIAGVRRDVEEWGMDFKIKNRLEQLVTQFIGHFSLIEKEEYPKEYNLFWCRSILDVFGDKNPFVEPLAAPLQIEEKELKRMCEGMPAFILAAYERSDTKGEAFRSEMEEFYVCSPYQLICDREEFQTLLSQVIENDLT